MINHGKPAAESIEVKLEKWKQKKGLATQFYLLEAQRGGGES